MLSKTHSRHRVMVIRFPPKWARPAGVQRKSHVLAVTLMALALCLAMLRPVCDLMVDVAEHDDSPEVCCAMAGDGTLAKPADSLARYASTSVGAMVVLVAAFAVAGIEPLRIRRARHAVPPLLPFHSRSARIRR
jgi:hypothetical protein